MYDVAIITSFYGGYDNLHPAFPQTGLSVEWIFVTDTLPEEDKGWRVIIDERPDMLPRRAAKYPKVLPWKYTDAYASIWIDGSFRVQSPNFAQEAMSYAKPIAQFKHPWRDCIFAEGECTRALLKYEDQASLVTEQMEYYRKKGHPEHWGLWATGVIARYHTKPIRGMGMSWMLDINQWSAQDQVSQAYSLRLADLYPELLPGDYFSSPWIQFMGHRREN